MGRPPGVFVRPVTMTEGRRLQRIGRTSRDPVRLRRAIVVRGLIHAFNETGFAALNPKWSGGRPKTISEHARRQICLLARCCPRDLGLAFSAWSLSKLAEHVVAAGMVASISRESIRQILRAAGISWQAVKTWKASADPDFAARLRRVLDLYDHPPAEGRVICADEFGPPNLQPRPGRAWRPAGHPARLRATYHRTGGVRHMLAALDLATGKITYRIRGRKRYQEFLSFLKLLRQRWPAGRLYLTCGNFSPHKHPEVTGRAAADNAGLVYLPVNASWLNWTEPEFTALRYFALNGTGHRTYTGQGDAIAACLRWHNARAQPRHNFAPGSVIRTWTSYQNKVA